MAKISMANPIVEMDGDEMTRIVWAEIKSELIHPFVEVNHVYFDLSLANRDKTNDQVTVDAANAIKKHHVGVKCATITANAERLKEYQLTKMWPSPNATIRSILDGTVFREPIQVSNIQCAVRTWEKPITIARHAYGDVYKAVELHAGTAGSAQLIWKPDTGSETIEQICRLEGPGVLQAIHNKDSSITSFARSCFRYALEKQQDLWFSAKDTISKQYDGTFRKIFQEIFEAEYQTAYQKAGINYRYTLIDDAIARAVRSKGGFVWACKNYDGDVISDMISSAFGSLAMMTSVLVSPDGNFEYEAAHGTVQRHYYRYMNGEQTSTNPAAMLFAWSGALRKRGELDDNPRLCQFADSLEAAIHTVIESGKVTADIAPFCTCPQLKILNTKEFLQTIRKTLSA